MPFHFFSHLLKQFIKNLFFRIILYWNKQPDNEIRIKENDIVWVIIIMSKSYQVNWLISTYNFFFSFFLESLCSSLCSHQHHFPVTFANITFRYWEWPVDLRARLWHEPGSGGGCKLIWIGNKDFSLWLFSWVKPVCLMTLHPIRPRGARIPAKPYSWRI